MLYLHTYSIYKYEKIDRYIYKKINGKICGERYPGSNKETAGEIK